MSHSYGNNSKNEFIEIPEVFYNLESKSMFSCCLSCNKSLLEENETYFIEKAIKNYPEGDHTDIIFEYAMCADCINLAKKMFSVESTQRIEAYFLKNVKAFNRRIHLLSSNTREVDPWISNCMFKGTPVSKLQEYQIICQCKGKYIQYPEMPYTIGFEAIEEVSELLSAKTKDEMDRFYDKFFDLPPELKEIFNRKLIFI